MTCCSGERYGSLVINSIHRVQKVTNRMESVEKTYCIVQKSYRHARYVRYRVIKTVSHKNNVH